MVGGKQYLSLKIGSQSTGTCLSKDTVAHEFNHAIGKNKAFLFLKLTSTLIKYFFKDLIMSKTDLIEIAILNTILKI